MRTLLLTIAVLLSTTATAAAGTRGGAVHRYADGYGSFQGWVLAGQTRVGGDDRHSRFNLRYLANPAADAGGCYATVVYVDSCPAKWYSGDFPFYMNVEAVAKRCGRGWFVVSTPLDEHYCHPLLRW